MVTINKIPQTGDWNAVAQKINQNFTFLAQEVSSVTIRLPQFPTVESAKKQIIRPYEGQMILIGNSLPLSYYRYEASADKWVDTTLKYANPDVVLDGYITRPEADNKFQELNEGKADKNSVKILENNITLLGANYKNVMGFIKNLDNDKANKTDLTPLQDDIKTLNDEKANHSEVTLLQGNISELSSSVAGLLNYIEQLQRRVEELEKGGGGTVVPEVLPHILSGGDSSTVYNEDHVIRGGDSSTVYDADHILRGCDSTLNSSGGETTPVVSGVLPGGKADTVFRDDHILPGGKADTIYKDQNIIYGGNAFTQINS